MRSWRVQTVCRGLRESAMVLKAVESASVTQTMEEDSSRYGMRIPACPATVWES
jgi:hypothetical protein